jgi:hypothetical protein
MTDAAHFRARAYTTPWRMVAGALVALSRASLLVIAAALLAADGPVPLLALVRALVVLSLLPALAATALGRALAVDVEVNAGALNVDRADLRIEVPRAAVARVAAWRVPLPGPGVSVWTYSGRRLVHGLEVADPTCLLAAMASSPPAFHPVVAWAHARASRPTTRWYHVAVKYVLFPILPAAVWFNAHQHIAYGGTFGQYNLEGAARWIQSLVIHWGLTVVYLLLYASVLRALAEAIALAAAAVAPSRAVRVRRLVELACSGAYYVGIPVLVALPFLL